MTGHLEADSSCTPSSLLSGGMDTPLDRDDFNGVVILSGGCMNLLCSWYSNIGTSESNLLMFLKKKNINSTTYVINIPF